ncbi:uncharacterized protein LOC131219985 [Magnolia sinica]|uniref:uncharacterized protein LOC131219985 n=1 Tax=Magnolia sinica TaxID=86752 RepID=UPI00265857FA|nr:uncharacterized protein LOC131219985 [Magnolia sinica]
MLLPNTEKEIRGFLGRIQYISQFIAQLTPIFDPIFKLLRKNSPKEWNDDRQTAFNKIKNSAHATYLRISKWQLLLSEFDITYVTQKVIKGQALAYHLVAHSLPDYQPLKTFFPDEDILLIEEEEERKTNSDWKTKDEKLIPYHVYLENLYEEFEEITFSYMPRAKNQFADTLDIKEYHKHQKYPEGATSTDHHIIQRLAAQFTITGGILYKRSINPKASNRHEYILVTVEYFTKWIEAASYTTITASHVVKFMKNNIISRYGIPQAIITDNGTPFVNKRMSDFLDKFKIQCHQTSPYRPQMNGGVEAANKTIIRILKKMVKKYHDWLEMLPYALWLIERLYDLL